MIIVVLIPILPISMLHITLKPTIHEVLIMILIIFFHLLTIHAINHIVRRHKGLKLMVLQPVKKHFDTISNPMQPSPLKLTDAAPSLVTIQLYYLDHLFQTWAAFCTSFKGGVNKTLVEMHSTQKSFFLVLNMFKSHDTW